MKLTLEQADSAILSTFHSMEENSEYILNHFWFSEMNRIRRRHGYSSLKDKRDVVLSRKGERLFINKKQFFDFKYETNLALSIDAQRRAIFVNSLAIPFALQHGGIEKLSIAYDGRVVEIDGKNYKLTAI